MNDLNNEYPVYNTTVTSSIIKEVQYDTLLHSLRVTFNSGEQYDYADVGEDIYKQLTEAPSIGSFFHRNIKGKFEYSRKVKKQKEDENEK